jgi:hypothetical protein
VTDICDKLRTLPLSEKESPKTTISLKGGFTFVRRFQVGRPATPQRVEDRAKRSRRMWVKRSRIMMMAQTEGKRRREVSRYYNCHHDRAVKATTSILGL